MGGMNNRIAVLALEYSPPGTTPKFGGEGSAGPIVDSRVAISLEYTIKMKKDINLCLTYRQIGVGDYWAESAGKDLPPASSFELLIR